MKSHPPPPKVIHSFFACYDVISQSQQHTRIEVINHKYIVCTNQTITLFASHKHFGVYDKPLLPNLTL